MTGRRQAFMIGLFVVVGLALVALGIAVATGGRLFARKEQAVMYFQGSIYGLQVGAPVVFRGVRLGSVSAIGLVHELPSDQFVIPVRVELDREGITTLHANGQRERHALRLADLVARGLSAQLAMQSLLTGQLYVDLDIRPDKAAARHRPPGRGAETEIPTATTTIQNLKAQLESLDVRQLAEDISGTARSVRDLVSRPALRASIDNLQQVTERLARLSDTLSRRADPLATEVQTTVRAARDALDRAARAADGVNDGAGRLGRAADQVSALADPQAPLVASLQRTADELAATAASLRAQTSPDAPLMLDVDRTLQDVGRAARSVRELAELLDRQPEALLRGRTRQESR